jgi:hypothetical protein
MYSKCAICHCDLTKGRDSSEHVIPNAIGGRLKVRGFLCVECNSETGTKWDAVLAKQLNALCILLGVERESWHEVSLSFGDTIRVASTAFRVRCES